MQLQDILDDFEFLDDWEDKYRFVIELGKDLTPLPESARTAANKVQGCTSQVWLLTEISKDDGETRLHFIGDSDAHIVRGLVAIIIAIYSGRTAQDICDTDALALIKQIGLSDQLSPQRSNGLASMVERIRRDASAALAS